MNYKLHNPTASEQNSSIATAFKKMWPLIKDEKRNVFLSLFAIILNSGLNLAAPIIVGYAVDNYIQTKQFNGVLWCAAILFGIYVVAFGANYVQFQLMGGLAQRVLFKLRNAIFQKLQDLPVTFFNQNKAGDLISRINNDTDRLNQFFSQSIMQFMGTVFVMSGAAIFVLSINIYIGAAALIPASILLIFNKVISPWVKRKNMQGLQTIGGMSAEIQESLNNFKVIVAFNRRNYFRDKFHEANKENFSASIKAGIANGIFTPIYDISANLAQLIVFSYGIYLIMHGQFTVGLLISFILYTSRFYDPVRQLASLWATFQTALAAWDRISQILAFESDMKVVHAKETSKSKALLEFEAVGFHYPDGKAVLHNIHFKLAQGKTYALVGPTGGGKTTTASLMARLYDPSSGKVFLEGKDIRSYTDAERTAKIGFILQEPYLFTGTLRENILYGNEEFTKITNEELTAEFKSFHLEKLLQRFEHGLDTKIGNTDTISLGQRQLIAFMRAVVRRPRLLILDEATANIDTVTEKLLEDIIKKLPEDTTRVIIAHRLNTIENADEIFFVNSGEVTPAGSMEHAVDMLLHGKRKS